MAKSLRAKSHLKAKSIKRKEVFQKTVDARVERLSKKLQENLAKQKEDAGESMEVDTGKKKVSTSGWRDARHHNYKKAKLGNKRKKKGSFTSF